MKKKKYANIRTSDSEITKWKIRFAFSPTQTKKKEKEENQKENEQTQNVFIYVSCKMRWFQHFSSKIVGCCVKH